MKVRNVCDLCEYSKNKSCYKRGVIKCRLEHGYYKDFRLKEEFKNKEEINNEKSK